MTVAAALRWLKTSSLWTYRTLLWLLVFVVLLCASVVLSLRYWILPNIQDFRGEIAQLVSEAAQQPITIGKISANWDGLRPRLVLEDVTVYDQSHRPALEFSRVDSTLSWRSLVLKRLSFHALDIYRPVLDIRRSTQGIISIAGIKVGGEDDTEGGGFAAWLLDQPDIEIHDGAVAWTDEMRQAPRLELKHVNLQIVNRGERHRFGLQAEAPSALARGLDVRADLRGRSLDVLADWNGRLFLQVNYVDIAAWQTWVSFPVEFPRGTGALRTWLTLSHGTVTQALADVRLSGVRTRLRPDLPELDLDTLSGRFGWKILPHAYEVSVNKLSLAAASAHLVLPPTDVTLHVDTDANGNVTGGQLQADSLSLAPLVMLADRLPLADAVRKSLATASPRGTLQDVTLKWQGSWPNPARYSARGHFLDASVNRWGALPGLTHVSGALEANEKGGSARIAGDDSTLDLPSLFVAPVHLNTLSGQFGWTLAKSYTEVRFQNVTIANADLAGSVTGSYRRRGPGDAELDITGGLTRADARAVSRYIPVMLVRKDRAWFERAFVAGHSDDVKFRVKGNVADFPFPDGKGGTFSVTAKLSGGVFRYATGWPNIENIAGELQFTGRRMDVRVRQASLYGVRFTNVRATIPNLDKAVVDVSGDAEGPTADFLGFIEKSPVTEMLGHFTTGMRATGRGRLALRLSIPLEKAHDTRVSGSYQFIDNNFLADPAIPALDHLNGRIEFTNSSVRIANASGVFLGGPVTMTGSTQRDGTVRVNMQGRIDADAVRRLGGGEAKAIMQHLRGAADWRGTFTLHKKLADLVIESPLLGMASDLPAPFGKSADRAVALRIERKYTGPGEQHVAFSYGDVASAQFALREVGGRTMVERGVVRLGGAAPGPLDRPGVWVSGSVGRLDFDQWLKLAGADQGLPRYSLSGLDVKIADTDVFGRDFRNLAVTATEKAGVLQVSIAGPQMEGVGTWRSQGKGRLTAHFKRLIVPAAEARMTAVHEAAAGPPPSKPLDLPALDIEAENFQLDKKQLGHLELTAVPEGRDWRIEHLRITNPDSTLTAEGVWQAWLTQPRTEVKVNFEVKDIGKTLVRWGYPEGVRGGTAKINGTLHWIGSPQEFDFPTLGGNLMIDAARGQFLKLDPGIAKLLGILSLQALPRRITLDFRDIFSQGFAFDAIVGALKINNGVATTDNLRMVGPSAAIMMRGSVDLARETQDLLVKVSPHLSDSVSVVGGLLGGPVAGVATFLAQKILRDPLDQIASYDYSITGTWTDPQVTKIEQPANAEATP